MIYLTKGQILKDNPGMVVYDPTGYYNDSDSIICAPIGFPEEPACRYEAKFIAYGGMVYSISDEDALMAEIIKLDPASLFGKDSQQIAVDKMVEKIVPQESGEIVKDATTEVVDTTDIETDPLPQLDELLETGDSAETEIGESTSTTTPTSTIPEIIPSDTTSTIPSTEVVPDPTTSASPTIEQTTDVLTSTESGL